MDDERVAALHDGRLDAHERDELLSRVLSDDEEYDIFAETAAVLREIEEAHASSPPSSAGADPMGVEPAADVAPHANIARGGHASDDVIPLATHRPPTPEGAAEPRPAEPEPHAGSRDGVISLDSRRRAPRRPWAMYGSIAAGLVGLGLAATLLTRARDTRLDDPAMAVAMLEDGAARGPAAGWNEVVGSSTRGGEANGKQLDPEPLNVQLGAYMVDIELAAASHDTSVVRLSRTIIHLLGQVTLGDSAAKFYGKVDSAAAANPRADVRPLLAQGREAVRSGVIVPEWLELGIWAEAARTAAARHDAGFFRSRRTRALLDRASTLPEMDGDTRAALKAVRAAIPVGGRSLDAKQWDELRRDIAGLLGAAGKF